MKNVEESSDGIASEWLNFGANMGWFCRILKDSKLNQGLTFA